MTEARPAGHVLLKQPCIHYEQERLFLIGAGTRCISSSDRRVIECLERGESELNLLCHSLSRTELGGDPTSIAESLMETLATPESILHLLPPMEIPRPDVIVCSFTEEDPAFASPELVRRLRRRFKVVHLGIEGNLRGRMPTTVTLESAKRVGAIQSPSEFFQWARSFIRFHAGSVLVLCGKTDHALFGDLAAKLPSLMILDPGWPTRTGLQALAGSESMVADPRDALRGLSYLIQLIHPKQLGRVERGVSSDVATLELFGLRRATQIAYTRADQRTELRKFGRLGTSDAPLYLKGPRSRVVSERGSWVFVATDHDSLEAITHLLVSLVKTIEARIKIEGVLLLTQHGWSRIRLSPNKVEVRTFEGELGPEELVGGVVLPGALRWLPKILRVMSQNVPILFVNPRESHVLTDELPAELRVSTDVEAFGERLMEFLDPDRRRELTRIRHRWCARWDLTDRIAKLVRSARRALEQGVQDPVWLLPKSSYGGSKAASALRAVPRPE